MCGRMTLTKRELAEIAEELAAVVDPASMELYRPRYNIAPTDRHFVLRSDERGRWLEPSQWGLAPAVAGRGPLFNGRAETIFFKEPFRSAVANGRCVVPADGFYEWRTTPDGRQPLWFHRADGKLLLMAGLCVEGRFTVLTTAPNDLVRPIHDRMPAILSPEEARVWLGAPTAKVLHPAPEGVLEARPVSSRVNSVKNDDPACLAPSEGPRQLTLV
jgi:putative SOS response-associated peptidase YedK